MPIPSMIRPKRSIARLRAEAFKADPIRKLRPPPIILALLPYYLVTGDAVSDAIKPER